MKKIFVTNCIVLVFVLTCLNLNGQVSVPNNTSGGANFVGWDNSVTVPLKIKQDHISPPYSIEFWTNQNKQMELDGATGNLGIGNAVTTSPPWKLTVEKDIDIECVGDGPPTEGYRWNEVLILCAPNEDNTLVGLYAGEKTESNENTFVGYQSGFLNVNGGMNTSLGAYSGYSNTSSENTFIGYASGATNSTGTENTFVGSKSGYLNTSANYNVFVGEQSGYSNEEGEQNTFTGAYSGLLNQNAGDNTFNGFQCGYSNIDGEDNSFFGSNSGFWNNASGNTFIGFTTGFNNTTGSGNTFVGKKSGFENVTGAENTFTGASSGNFNTDGASNTFNGFQSGYNNLSGSSNTFIGKNSGYSNEDAGDNTFVGFEAGYSNTYNNNTMIGHFAGRTNTIGSLNTFVGKSAGQANLDKSGNTYIGYGACGACTGESNTTVGTNTGGVGSGSKNSFFGNSAGGGNTTGYENTFLGYKAGSPNSTGYKNTYVGAWAAYTQTSGNENTIIGESSMWYMSGGDRNTAVGARCGFSFETGDDNTLLGYQAGKSNSSGNENVFVGRDAGFYNQTGSRNVYLGFNSGQTSSSDHTIYNSIAIGYDAIVRKNNHMILGNNEINVGIGLSDDATGPRSKLEINTSDASPSSSGGHSGLQFTDLTTSSTVNTSAFSSGGPQGVLSVDADGKVILVEDKSSSGLFECSGGGIPNQFIPLMSNTTTNTLCISDIYNDYSNHKVGINTSPSTPAHTLDVNGDINIPLTNAYFINNGPFLKSNGSDVELGFNAGPSTANSNDYSIFIGELSGNSITEDEVYNTFVGVEAGRNTSATTSPSSEGSKNVYLGSKAGQGLATGQGSENVFIGHAAVGQYSNLNDGNRNIVIGSQAGNTNNSSGSENIIIGYNSNVDGGGGGGTISNAVVIGTGIGTTTNDAFVCGNNDNRILMGYTSIPTIGSPTNDGFRLYVNAVSGNDAGFFNGRVFENSAYVSSDVSLKRNIQPMNSIFSRTILSQLSPRSYEFDIIGNPSLNLEPGIQYGLIANEVEQFLPGLVHEVTAPPIVDSLGNIINPEKTFKALNYTGLVPFLIQAIKDQQKTIDSLVSKDSIINNRIDQLEQVILNCCQSGSMNRTVKPVIDVELSNSIILNQNDPNPFAEETRITYNIPGNVLNAKIIFFDNSNRIVQTVNINERGEGELHVYAGNLSSGIYSYSLIAEGKVVDTKKMVCNK